MSTGCRSGTGRPFAYRVLPGPDPDDPNTPANNMIEHLDRAVRIALLIALAALLAGLYLWQASEIATTGRRIEMLRQQQQALERENAELLDQIALLSCPQQFQKIFTIFRFT